MSITKYPYAVCTECKWVQIHHGGNLRASRGHASHHKQTTGHTTRIKTHHEFADVLWSDEFIFKAYGAEAHRGWLKSLPDAVLDLLYGYTIGRLPLEVCEYEYTLLNV